MPGFRLKLANKARKLLAQAGDPHLQRAQMREAYRSLMGNNLLPGDPPDLSNPQNFSETAFRDNGALDNLAVNLTPARVKMIMGQDSLADMTNLIGPPYE